MESFGCMVKSYKKDFSRVKALSESFQKFCMDETKLHIIVPEDEIDIFSILAIDNIYVHPESIVPVTLVSQDISGIRPGYINQELIKLSFWKTNLLENYLCLDSDGIFIRTFDKTDFMYSDSEPFTVMVDDKDLMVQPKYRDIWVSREKSIRRIYETYELPQPRYIRTTHGFQVFNREVLFDMQLNFLEPRNLTYLDLLQIAPYEFSWYTIYLQKMGGNIRQTEPFFKIYHEESQFLSDLILGVNSQSLSNGFIGLVVNSNFQPENKQIDLNTKKVVVLSYYLSFRELSTAIILKSKFVPFHLKVLTYKIIKKPLEAVLCKAKKFLSRLEN